MRGGRRPLLVAIGVITACVHPHATGGEGQPVVETIHHRKSYEVNPLNPDDLRRSVSDQWRCGGIECKIGETQSRTSYTFNSAMTPAGSCAMTMVHVIVETTITIPHWEGTGVTSPARRNWWAQIQGAVTRHEDQHVYIAEDGGKAIADSLGHLTSPSCSALRQLAAATANGELLRVRQRQADFDRTQGPLQITAPPP